MQTEASSSYYESLVALNKRFAAEKKPPVALKEAPETLEDEDLVEMLNAGLIALIVVDKHLVFRIGSQVNICHGILQEGIHGQSRSSHRRQRGRSA